jgi:hypothetical protein
MRHLLTILAALAILAAPAAAQTIKTLGYNTTNGQIVAATNAVWTNSFSFSTNTVAAQVRTNLALPLLALTNTNAANFRAAISAADSTGLSPDNAGTANRAIAIVNNDSGGDVLEYDGLSGDGWTIADASGFQKAIFAATNAAPTNTTNVSAWTTIQIGTNAFRVPLYQ